MNNKKCNYIYTFSMADMYELPMAVADTLEDLSKLTGFGKTTLCMALERNSVVAGSFRVRKVLVNDSEFNFEDYIEFCKTEDLKPSSAISLQKFKEYCGDTYVDGL